MLSNIKSYFRQEKTIVTRPLHGFFFRAYMAYSNGSDLGNADEINKRMK